MKPKVPLHYHSLTSGEWMDCRVGGILSWTFLGGIWTVLSEEHLLQQSMNAEQILRTLWTVCLMDCTFERLVGFERQRQGGLLFHASNFCTLRHLWTHFHKLLRCDKVNYQPWSNL